jgi:hypothetical protein
MKCMRIYADAAGKSRFDEVDIELGPVDFAGTGAPIDLSAPVDAARVIFVSFPAGWVGERHTAPRRQFFVQQTGVLEVEGADGATIRTGPGGLTLVEDITGSGHITRVIGGGPVTGAFVQLPE